MAKIKVVKFKKGCNTCKFVEGVAKLADKYNIPQDADGLDDLLMYLPCENGCVNANKPEESESEEEIEEEDETEDDESE